MPKYYYFYFYCDFSIDNSFEFISETKMAVHKECIKRAKDMEGMTIKQNK